MKQRVCKCAIGILAILFLNTAVAANASEIQENIVDVHPGEENTPEAMASGWREVDRELDHASGWEEIGGERYYFSPETGAMAIGWQEINGERYYFSPETGAMAADWQKIGGERYYFLPETGAMAAGWRKIDGERYYFLPETGAMAVGWRKIDGERYYFLPESGAIAAGWQKIDGDKYYFSPKTGNMLQGRQEIGKKAYFFKKSGVLCTSGWAGADSKTYYCGAQGTLASGWKKIKGHKYYFLPKNNRMATGRHKVNGSDYIFRENGKLARSGGITIVTVGGKVYCAGADGKAAGGWQVKKRKLYYASKKGTVKRSTTFQGITFTKTGAAKENIASKLKIKLIKDVAAITNEKMDRKTKLAAFWSYLTGGNFRYASKYPNLNASGWQRRTAYDMLTTHTGNCYSFACAFAALASEIGYQPYVICGRVHGSRDRSADGYTRHAWVMINGKHYDPEADYAGWLRNVYARSSYPVSNQIQKTVAYNE